MARDVVRFVRRGQIVERRDFAPTETLLDHLRLRERAFGTKEGCAEGDCGACTVAVGRLRGGRLAYEPVNSCIQLVGMLDGTEVVAVDDLAPSSDDLHPVQRALVDAHASQCGFCTPGFVMTLFTLYHAGVRADRTTVNDWLAGNLCRCTGYRPISDAALACCTGEAKDAWASRAAATADRLAAIADGADLFAGDENAFFAAPATEDELAAIAARYPDATIVGGATDVGLWITKQLRELPRIVHTGRVASLHEVREHEDRVEIGAAATYAEAERALAAIDPDIGEMLRRLGSKQVRAAGTIGGNIANGSPIGDSPPVLIALGASIELRLGDTRRTLPLEDFFLDYGRQDRSPGEVLTRIVVPRLGSGEHFRCYKISKRFDQDISALLGAFRLAVEGGRVVAARIAYGGMAATPKRATRAERAATGLALDRPASWSAAAEALAADFTPIDDHRASADYRLRVARSLLLKALTEIAGRPTGETRVVGARERSAAA
ncbi:MAG: xanthine dehydrogenase small subunit [Immundisolibacterales bacterium]|nr:xanthine dehydrogenase small subunit [Immundisolibacterales bacterium]